MRVKIGISLLDFSPFNFTQHTHTHTIAMSSQKKQRGSKNHSSRLFALVRLSDMRTQWELLHYYLYIHIFFSLHSLHFSVRFHEYACECLLAQIYGYKYFSNEMRKLYVIKANVCQTICFRSMFFCILSSS